MGSLICTSAFGRSTSVVCAIICNTGAGGGSPCDVTGYFRLTAQACNPVDGLKYQPLANRSLFPLFFPPWAPWPPLISISSELDLSRETESRVFLLSRSVPLYFSEKFVCSFSAFFFFWILLLWILWWSRFICRLDLVLGRTGSCTRNDWFLFFG